MPIKYWVKMGFGLYMGVFLGRVVTTTIGKMIEHSDKKKEEKGEEITDSRE